MTSKIPLLMVPGLSCNRLIWEPQIQALKDVVTPWVAPLPAYETLGEIADAILRDAPKRFALAGISMGGYLSFEIYKRAPERVTHLALIATTATAEKPATARRRRMMIRAVREKGFLAMWSEFVRRMVHPDRLKDEEFIDALLRQGYEVGSEAFCSHQYALMNRPSYEDILETISCPTIHIAGLADVPTPVEEQLKMSRRIPGCRVHLAENAGHLPTLETPEQTTGWMHDWLMGEEMQQVA